VNTAHGAVWVTGAAGAIGHAVVRHLFAQDEKVGAIGHGSLEPSITSPTHGPPIFENCSVDSDGLLRLLEKTGKPKLIIHLAGGSQVGSSIENPLADFDKTTRTTVELLTFISTHLPDVRLVYASSAAVYGEAMSGPISEAAITNPISPYGFHKLEAERVIAFWCQRKNLDAAIVRLFSVYGPGLRKQLIFDLFNRMDGTEAITLGGTGAELRDWLYIDDAARLLVGIAARASAEAPIFNGGTGLGHDIKSVAQAVADAAGYKGQILFSGEVRAGDPHSLIACPNRVLESGFGDWTDFTHGINATVGSYRLAKDAA
jgi:UDP-glucose 4-epimerase